MNSEKGNPKISIIALIIAIFAMIGTMGNFLFAVWEHKQQEKTIMLVSCEILPDSKVEFKDSNFPLAIGKEGFMASTDKNGKLVLDQSDVPSRYTYYPKIITFYVECKITNMSSKKVSIEEVYSYIDFGKPTVIHPAFFQGIFNQEGGEIAFPKLLDQGEQIVYLIKVGWPLDKKLTKAVEVAIQSPNLTIMDLYTRLFREGVDLNYESDSKALRTLGITVKTADETGFSKPLKFSFIVLK